MTLASVSQQSGSVKAAPPTLTAESSLSAWFRQGYAPSLIPIAPPGVTLTLGGGRTKMSDGKVPATWDGQSWRPFQGWVTRRCDDKELRALVEDAGAGIGLVTGSVAAFDIDVKVAVDETGPRVAQYRAFRHELVEAIKNEIGIKTEAGIVRVPARWRANSTSCAVFARQDDPGGKVSRTFIDPQDESRSFKLEFLSEGQQIVVAGKHESGASIQSSLCEWSAKQLPSINRRQIDNIFGEAERLAGVHGLLVKAPKEGRTKAISGPLAAPPAIDREIMRRRGEWIDAVLPVRLPLLGGELRISSHSLERDLQEDLSIFPDGIFDFGTERTHSPISLIREFGRLRGDHIEFGGCPLYGMAGNDEFAVIGEADTSIVRPNQQQAASWLVQRLAGENVETIPINDDADIYPALCAALGVEWSELVKESTSQRWFDASFTDAKPTPPSEWTAAELKANAHRLPAMRLLDPAGFATSEFAWDMRGVLDGGKLPEPDIVPAVATADPWPEPRDVFGDGDGRALDLEAGVLPPILDGWAADTARRMGVSMSFTGAAALATLSGAIGARFRIQPKARDRAWTEPGFLWVALIEPPGGLKSPTISAATRPLAALDAELHAIDSRAHAQWSERRSQRRKGGADPGLEPTVRRRLVENFTLEALSGVLKDNSHGVLIRLDELAQLIGSIDAYKSTKGSDRAQLLSLFDGRDTRIDRVSRGAISIPMWGAAMLSGIQPRRITELAPGLDSDGLLQRLLPVMGDGLPRPVVDEDGDPECQAAYEHLIRDIASANLPCRSVVTLSPEAQEIWRPLADSVTALKSLPDLSEAWLGHLGKWPGISARLLLAMHVGDQWVETSGFPDTKQVSKATAERAVCLVEWLLSHSMRFYATCVGAGKAVEDARWIAGHILSAGTREFITRRDIGQARREFRSEAPAISAAMLTLEYAGWAIPLQERMDRFGPTRWKLSPRVFSTFAERGRTERLRRDAEREKIAASIAERRRILKEAV